MRNGRKLPTRGTADATSALPREPEVALPRQYYNPRFAYLVGRVRCWRGPHRTHDLGREGSRGQSRRFETRSSGFVPWGRVSPSLRRRRISNPLHPMPSVAEMTACLCPHRQLQPRPSVAPYSIRMRTMRRPSFSRVHSPLRSCEIRCSRRTGTHLSATSLRNGCAITTPIR